MSKAAEMAADWWTERLQQGNKAAFRAALVTLIDAELTRRGSVRTQVDYDPDSMLREALKAAGVECRGFMFSADDILPRKHELWIKPDRLEPKEGYGNWTAHIPVPAE